MRHKGVIRVGEIATASVWCMCISIWCAQVPSTVGTVYIENFNTALFHLIILSGTV